MHFTKGKFYLIVLTWIFLFNQKYFSQEHNYWSNNFGAKSTLLCGAAVSNYFDNGAIFYNPATLCFKDSGYLSLSANLYEYESLTRTNALGDGLSLSSSNFNFSPQIVSGNKKIGDKAELEFILMSKTDVQFNQSLSFNKMYYDTLIFNAQQSLYVGSYNLKKRVLDEWGGLSMSFKLSEKWGFGFGTFFSYRMYKYQMSMNASSIGTDTIYPSISKSDSALTVNTNNLNLILKSGIVYNGEKNNFGLTVTLPSIRLRGKGDLEYSIFFSGIYFIPVDVYIRRINVNTIYKYPGSIAVGYTRKYKRSKLHFTAEVFGRIDPYYTLKISDATGISGSGNVSLGGEYVKGIKEGKRPIANLAIGYEKVLKGTLELLMGFSTDFRNNTESADISFLDYNFGNEAFNLFHYSLGVGFQHNKNNIAIGLAGSLGSRFVPSIADFQNPTVFSKFFGYNVYGNNYNTYKSIGIVVGLTY
ncbi:MAG: hypothetical protein ACK5D5_02055 [Bacteroidota bacterium]|jgi:hypothetical protein